MVAKTVKLTKPFEMFDKLITEVEVTEPTGSAYIDFGEPWLFVRNPEGTFYTVEQPDVVGRYIDSFLKANDDVWGLAVKKQLCLADMKKVKAALLDFFTDADVEAFSKKSTPSPSDGNASTSTQPSP